MSVHLTPTEIGRAFGLHRRKVIWLCMQWGVPIFEGLIDENLFRAMVREHPDSGDARRNTPTASRGATSAPKEARAKRTEKTGGRGNDLDSQTLASTETDHGPSNPCAGTESHRGGGGIDTLATPTLKPRRRTVGSIVVPELPWKRDA